MERLKKVMEIISNFQNELRCYQEEFQCKMNELGKILDAKSDAKLIYNINFGRSTP